MNRHPEDPLACDFRLFLCVVWKHLKLPQPTKRQLAIASYLQHGPRRRVIEAFRGIGKSWITAAFVCWLLYRNPSLNILVVSASKQRADNFTTFVLRLITEIEILRHLIPRDSQRNSKLAFDVGPAPASQTPSVVSLGITGTMTGNRADYIIADDVEVPNNSATQMMREKLAELIKEFDAILKPNGQVIFLGTPQTESSIYNTLRNRGYEFRVWTARYPREADRAMYGNGLAPDILRDLQTAPHLVDRTTEPDRFTDKDLAEREASYGRAGFALQFMLNTRLSDVDRYPLKMADLVIASHIDAMIAPERVVWAGSPEYMINDLPNVGLDGDKLYRPMPVPDLKWLPYTGKVMAIDPSGRGKDETAYAVVACLHGQLFLLDSGGFQSGYSPHTLEGLAKIAFNNKVNKIIVEANFGDGMFSQLLKPVLNDIYPCAVEEVKHNVQKEKRIIDTLEPVTSAHRLIVSANLIRKDFDSTSHMPTENMTGMRYQLFYQLTRITRERGSLMVDDRLDALAMAVAYWTQHMSQDVNKVVEKSREKALLAELRKFVGHAVGRRVGERTACSRPGLVC